MLASAPSTTLSFILSADSASLQRDLPISYAVAVRSLRSAVVRVRSLGDRWRRPHKGGTRRTRQGIHAAADTAAAPLSRENCEAQPRRGGESSSTSHLLEVLSVRASREVRTKYFQAQFATRGRPMRPAA